MTITHQHLPAPHLPVKFSKWQVEDLQASLDLGPIASGFIREETATESDLIDSVDSLTSTVSVYGVRSDLTSLVLFYL